MEIEENELEKERAGSRVVYVYNWLMALYVVTYWLSAEP